MRTVTTLLLAVGAVFLSGPVSADDTTSQALALFAAAEAGQIELKVIPKDARQATILISNKSDRPLRIQLPEAFAAVPILAQGDVAGGGNIGGRSSGFGGGGIQSFGGGFGGGLGGAGFGGGLFDVASEEVARLKVATICLEHGKRDPKPKIPFQLKPIEAVTSDVRLQEVCKMLGRGEIAQTSAQAAAWHLLAGLSWDELAAKVKVRHLNGEVEHYFNPADLAVAIQATAEATRRAAFATTPPPEGLSAKPQDPYLEALSDRPASSAHEADERVP